MYQVRANTWCQILIVHSLVAASCTRNTRQLLLAQGYHLKGFSSNTLQLHLLSTRLRVFTLQVPRQHVALQNDRRGVKVGTFCRAFHRQTDQKQRLWHFEDSLTQIESIVPAATFGLKLPRVIVVGERSVGKSSLLENFTKCSIFPRGKGTCTKMPVRLQIKAVTSLPKYIATVRYNGRPDINLTSTDGVLAAVQTIMDQAQGITANEITVEISQVTPAYEP